MEKVFAPVPLKVIVPLLVIPARNSKGTMLDPVRLPPEFTVSRPVKSLVPVAPLTSQFPLRDVVPETVNAPVWEWVTVFPAPNDREGSVTVPPPARVDKSAKVVWELAPPV